MRAVRRNEPRQRQAGGLALAPEPSLRRSVGPARTLAGAVAVTGALLPAFYALRLVHRPASERLPHLYMRGLARALGIETKVHGEPVSGTVLYVSNHLSWVDIPVLGSRLHGSFVAKREVADMGLVGRFADLGQTIYVDRTRRLASSAQASEIAARLRDGGNIILFPEGTSGDGRRVLPFKSSLFAAAQGVDRLRVQPVSLAYTAINGLPVTRNRILDIAWIGDMEFAPHLMEVTRLGRIRAELLFHAPIEVGPETDRKALARQCHQIVARGYARLMRGEA